MAAEGHVATYLRSIGVADEVVSGLSIPTLGFAAALDAVRAIAPTIAEATLDELRHQRTELKLIASENYADPSVLLAMGSWLTDKYAEGSAGHRFYAGCERVDAIEMHAAEVCRALFGADHAYVQPHSGIDANLVAFWAVLTERVQAPFLAMHGAATVHDLDADTWERLRAELHDQTLLGMDLNSGGHLTHGFRHNISGKLFRHAEYSVDPSTGLLDYEEVRRQAQAHRPLILLAGYSSYPRRLSFRVLREIADEVGAVLMVDMAHFAGLVAGKVMTGDEDPVPFADIVTSTTHKTLRGPRGGFVLCKSWLADAVDRGCPLVLGGPLPHMMAAKAVAFELASRPAFADYAAGVAANAQALADALADAGLEVVSEGTDNHLLLVDVRPLGLTGRQAEAALSSAGITVNRNVVPGETNGAWYTSGIRLGTPALTTRGFDRAEIVEVAALVHKVLVNTKAGYRKDGTPSPARYELSSVVRDEVAAAAHGLLARYPLYGGVQLG